MRVHRVLLPRQLQGMTSTQGVRYDKNIRHESWFSDYEYTGYLYTPFGTQGVGMQLPRKDFERIGCSSSFVHGGFNIQYYNKNDYGVVVPWISSTKGGCPYVPYGRNRQGNGLYTGIRFHVISHRKQEAFGRINHSRTTNMLIRIPQALLPTSSEQCTNCSVSTNTVPLRMAMK
nr:uncharacterized protein LOC115255690 [Aedes albopictus]